MNKVAELQSKTATTTTLSTTWLASMVASNVYFPVILHFLNAISAQRRQKRRNGEIGYYAACQQRWDPTGSVRKGWPAFKKHQTNPRISVWKGINKGGLSLSVINMLLTWITNHTRDFYFLLHIYQHTFLKGPSRDPPNNSLCREKVPCWLQTAWTRLFVKKCSSKRSVIRSRDAG